MNTNGMSLLAVIATVLVAAAVFLGAESYAASSLEGDKQELERLIDRVVKTKSIGIFSKLAMKGDAENLWRDLGKYHSGAAGMNIDELDERYHLIVHKLELSIRKRDKDLAQAIADFREPLWQRLENPDSFTILMS
jgi:hypothetical protein